MIIPNIWENKKCSKQPDQLNHQSLQKWNDSNYWYTSGWHLDKWMCGDRAILCPNGEPWPLHGGSPSAEKLAFTGQERGPKRCTLHFGKHVRLFLDLQSRATSKKKCTQSQQIPQTPTRLPLGKIRKNTFIEKKHDLQQIQAVLVVQFVICAEDILNAPRR